MPDEGERALSVDDMLAAPPHPAEVRRDAHGIMEGYRAGSAEERERFRGMVDSQASLRWTFELLGKLGEMGVSDADAVSRKLKEIDPVDVPWTDVAAAGNRYEEDALSATDSTEALRLNRLGRLAYAVATMSFAAQYVSDERVPRDLRRAAVESARVMVDDAGAVSGEETRVALETLLREIEPSD
jgi:hypothetical protein